MFCMALHMFVLFLFETLGKSQESAPHNPFAQGLTRILRKSQSLKEILGRNRNQMDPIMTYMTCSAPFSIIFISWLSAPQRRRSLLWYVATVRIIVMICDGHVCSTRTGNSCHTHQPLYIKDMRSPASPSYNSSNVSCKSLRLRRLLTMMATCMKALAWSSLICFGVMWRGPRHSSPSNGCSMLRSHHQCSLV